MRVQVIQHVEFERPGLIALWAGERGHTLAVAEAWTGELPMPGAADLLIVLGGPMGADDAAAFPWLSAEKHYLAGAIAEGVPVLGVCLGAQILATVIGGAVRRNHAAEIGWFPITRTPEGETSLLSSWPSVATVGHWHGDTFELPPGTRSLYSSATCRNQAFVYHDRVVGLQFHLEWTPELMADMVAACSDELAEPVATPAPARATVMSADELLVGVAEYGVACRDLLFELLDHLASLAAREEATHE